MEIVHRLATLERVAPQVVRDLDEALQAEFRSSGTMTGNHMPDFVMREIVGDNGDHFRKLAVDHYFLPRFQAFRQQLYEQFPLSRYRSG